MYAKGKNTDYPAQPRRLTSAKVDSCISLFLLNTKRPMQAVAHAGSLIFLLHADYLLMLFVARFFSSTGMSTECKNVWILSRADVLSGPDVSPSCLQK